jgi:hypothetical protein
MAHSSVLEVTTGPSRFFLDTASNGITTQGFRGGKLTRRRGGAGGEGTEASGQKSEDRGQETGHSGAGVDGGAVTSDFEGLLEVVEPLFLLVAHAIDAETDGFGVERGGVDAEEPVDSTVAQAVVKCATGSHPAAK